MTYSHGLIACLAILLLASGCCGIRCGTSELGAYDDLVDGEVVDECGCGDCGDVAFPSTCGSRASGGCGGLSGLFLPLMSTRLACGSGCGGVYWGEWMNDPPECCDPCTDCGCWVEPRCCGHQGLLSRCWGRLRNALHVGIYGYRPAGCDEGCESCGGCADGCESCGGCADGGEPYSVEDGESLPVEEVPLGVAQPDEITYQMRAKHGRSPHPLVSRQLRR